MSVYCLCSATGAPGVTATALALGWVWPLLHPDRRVLVVDADPAGSGVLPGYAQAGVPVDGGVLAVAAQRQAVTPQNLVDHAVALDPDARRLVLLGVTSAAQARALAPVWRSLSDVAVGLDAAGIDVVVDAGRLGHRYEPAPLVESAAVLAVVLGSSLASVSAAAQALTTLRATRQPGAATTAVLVGDGDPYSAREIARELGVDRVPVIATDRWAARALAGAVTGGWRMERSALLRSARDLVQHLTVAAAPVRVGASS